MSEQPYDEPDTLTDDNLTDGAPESVEPETSISAGTDSVYAGFMDDPAQYQQAGYAPDDPAQYQQAGYAPDDPAQYQQAGYGQLGDPDTTGTWGDSYSDQTGPAEISDPNGIPYGY